MSTVIANAVEITAHGASRVTHNDAELRPGSSTSRDSGAPCAVGDPNIAFRMFAECRRPEANFLSRLNIPARTFFCQPLQPVPLGVRRMTRQSVVNERVTP